MGAIPDADSMRAHLEGYNITTSILSDTWIEDERDNTIVPFVEEYTGSLSAEETKTEYYSGNGTDTLMLNRRNINSLVSIEFVRAGDLLGNISLGSIQLIASEGILKAKTNISEGLLFSLFSKGEKNIRIAYKIGGTVKDDIEMAIKKLTCVAMLTNLEGRTGGGA